MNTQNIEFDKSNHRIIVTKKQHLKIEAMFFILNYYKIIQKP